MSVQNDSSRLKIVDLAIKKESQSYFLLKYIAIQQAKDGRSYLNIILADATGELEARIWQDADQIAQNFQKGDIVEVKGKLNLFQGRKQFIIQEIKKLNKDTVDMEAFTVRSPVNPEIMMQQLLAIVQNLTDRYIKELLLNLLNDEEIARRLKKWQAGKTIHHAYSGGLLEHILSCTQLAMTLSAHYQVNENYVVAGAIIHDLCKIYELTDDINVEYTEEGKLVGHLVKGVELIDRFSYRIPEFPFSMKLHLKHIIVSHHGEFEYGSPKVPSTKEAMLLHLIDLMDSKMHSFMAVIRSDQNQGHWSGYVKHLDRMIYKVDLPFFPVVDDEALPAQGPKQKTQLSSPAPEPKGALAAALKNFKV